MIMQHNKSMILIKIWSALNKEEAIFAKCDYRLENYIYFVGFRGVNLAVGVLDRGIKM